MDHFYPRSPCGERRTIINSNRNFTQFLSTLSLRRATIISKTNRRTAVPFLSTLSLRRATCSPGFGFCRSRYFYPRSPCGERRRCGLQLVALCYFYPRSPCGERQPCRGFLISAEQFLSTLSLRRATLFQVLFWQSIQNFYPRSPCGERRSVILFRVKSACISIHALLAESDILLNTQQRHIQISIHALLAESDL